MSWYFFAFASVIFSGVIHHLERPQEALKEAARVLAAWQLALPEPTDRASHELESLVTCARLMTEAALLREESRGVHFRTDFPKLSSAWERHITFRRDDANGRTD